jgi:voltage-gated potassium channel
LRVFRVLKLARLVSESAELREAVWESRRKILVFLITVLSIVSILGAAMYLIEKNAGSGFDSIPQSMYWAIVTLTTVGYGDIAPATPLGKVVSVTIMLLGYSMIIVPTGILSAEFAARPARVSGQVCHGCAREGHAPGAKFCQWCGDPL